MQTSAGPEEAAPVVVVYEDDDLLRVTLAELLSDLGFRVVQVAEPESLESIVSASSAQLLVTDGLWDEAHLSSSARDRIRALGALVPTLIVSGRAWVRQLSADELGVASLLPKPFDVDGLEREIRRCLAAAGQPCPARV